MQDRDIDNLANPHEVKHWMDPKLIPYGWGLFEGLDDNAELGEKKIFLQHNIHHSSHSFVEEERLKLFEDPPQIMVISPSALQPLVD